MKTRTNRCIAEPLEARQLLSVSGVNFQYYQGTWTSLPNFATLTPIKTGVTHNFDLSIRKQDTGYGFVWTGNLSVATAGSYTFYTASDDGSELLIDGSQVVDNDGVHTLQQMSGNVALSAGTHTITVEYFQNSGSQQLAVDYSGPGVSMQAIPDAVLTTTAPGTLDVANYGAVGNGTTNDSAAIQFAINSAPDGATLDLDAGKTYLLGTGLALSRPLNLVGNGATLLLDTSSFPSNEEIYYASPTASATYSWTGAVSAGQTTLNVAISPDVLLPGDTVYVSLGTDPNDSTQPNWGEVCQVTANTGSAVTINMPVPYDINEGSAGNSIRRLTDVGQNTSISGVNFNYVSGTTPDANVFLQEVRNITLSGLTGQFTIMANVAESQDVTITGCSGTLNKLDSSSGRMITAYQSDGLTATNNTVTTSYDAPPVFLESWDRNTLINGLTINWNYSSPSAQDVFHFTGNSYGTTANNITINNVGAIDLIETGGEAASYSFGTVQVSGPIKAAPLFNIGDLINGGQSYDQAFTATNTFNVTVGSNQSDQQIQLCSGVVETMSFTLSSTVGITTVFVTNSSGGGYNLTGALSPMVADVLPQFFGTDYSFNTVSSPQKTLHLTTGTVRGNTILTGSVTYYTTPVAPTVQSFTVNGGAVQRSMVTSAAVTFTQPVTLAAGAITLTQRSPTGGAGTPIAFTLTPSANSTVYTLTFANNGSLADGIYDLTVVGGTADASSTLTNTTTQTYTFDRLFGDINGDGVVNNYDYALFGRAFGSSVGQSAYVVAFDYNGDGVINNLDYAQFGRRFGMSYVF